MKHAFWAAGVLAASLLIGRVGHATEGWVQIPGAAALIAVGANDIPFILDTNGYVEYLAPPGTSCGHGICVESPRYWKGTNITASAIACDQYGYLWRTDSVGGLGMIFPQEGDGFGTELFETGVAAAISSLAPGRMKPYSEWNVPFGVPASNHQLIRDELGTVPFTTTYVTGAGSPSLSSIDLTLHVQYTNLGYFVWRNVWYDSSGWRPIDTGEVQVSQFTIDGSADQIPWFTVVGSDGLREAFSMPTPGNYHYVGRPVGFGVEYEIDWISDHYVAARFNSVSAIWRWTGDAYGNNGQWYPVANSQLPNKARIAMIAYSAALPGTRIGTIGPSHLYALDVSNNIYQWGTVGDPVK